MNIGIYKDNKGCWQIDTLAEATHTVSLKVLADYLSGKITTSDLELEITPMEEDPAPSSFPR